MTEIIQETVFEESILDILLNHGIERSSKSWGDYSKAKSLLPELDEHHYNLAIRAIADWLEL